MTNRFDKVRRTADAVSSAEPSTALEETAVEETTAVNETGVEETTAVDEKGVEETTAADPTPTDEPQESGLRQVTLAGAPLEGGDRPSGELRTTPPSSTDRSSAEQRTSVQVEPSTDPYIGQVVDSRYHVEKVLGEGGMGVVYRCRHTIIGKKVAMKVLRADLARNSEVTERFLNEAKSASSIGNPHIIDISDFGRLPDGSTYFVMEYLEGEALATLVDKGGPVPAARLLHIAEQLAEGLYSAHEAGIVHRDLKPDNIFLIPRAGEDFVKILDFGIAKASSTEGKLTQAGQVFGTPHYMSPEQAAGSPIDHRADIYSLGIILYEMACGTVPFDADSFMGILTQHMYKSPPPLGSIGAKPQASPPGLEAIILKCLSKRREQRYPTMHALLEDLHSVSADEVPKAAAELMRRPGRFSLPRDYFGGAARRDGSAREGAVKARWPLYAGLGGLGVTLAAVVLSTGGPPTTAPLEEAETLAARSTPTTLKQEPPAAVRPARQQVVLAVAPLDARVYRGAEDLGTSPVVVELEEGEQVVLRVEKKGYESTQVVLDGSQEKLSVALEKKVPTAPKPPTAPKRPSNSEIVNPWE